MRANGFNVDFIWIFPEVGGDDPGGSDPADPVERALDAAGLDRPGPVPRGLRRRGLGVGRAVRAHRRAGGAADLGDRARRGRAPVRVGRGRVPGRDPAALDGLHGPARQLLALPAARHRVALDGRARACVARTPAARSCWPGLFAGLATLARNDGLFVLAVARARLRVGSLAVVAGRRVADDGQRRAATPPASRGPRPSARSRSSSW